MYRQRAHPRSVDTVGLFPDNLCSWKLVNRDRCLPTAIGCSYKPPRIPLANGMPITSAVDYF